MRKYRWLFFALAVVLFAVLAYGMTAPYMTKALNPPPSGEMFVLFKKSLTKDGLPVKPERLIVCELDRPSYVGEGVLTVSWESVTAQAKPAESDPSVFVLKTKEGDLAQLRLLGNNRVRILTGTDMFENDMHLFADELKTGQGEHPPYVKQ